MKARLYSTKCPSCIILAKMLKRENIEFEVITDEESVLNASKESGINTAPILEIADSVYLSFLEAMKWVKNSAI